MTLSEQQLLELCKKAIEKKFSFGNDHGYTQRDLEMLSRHIQEKTGVNISLSTLKRLWKNSHKQSPQLATLDALVNVLDFKDWQHFKTHQQRHHIQNIKRSRPRLKMAMMAIGVLLLGAFLISSLRKQNGTIISSNLSNDDTNSPIIVKGPISFSANKTVDKGIPNTVIFNYDLSNVEADSYHLQQSWNIKDRVEIDKEGTVFSRMYVESGFHRAKLYANDSILARVNIHILSEGWEPHLYYNNEDSGPIDLKKESFIQNGIMHFQKSSLEKRNIDCNKSFYTRITNSQEYGISSNDFSVETRIKSDSTFDKLCPWMRLMVITEKHIFYITMVQKGCERTANYKVGEINRVGKDNDLSALGADIYQWQKVNMSIKNKSASIFINDVLSFEEDFTEEFGDVKAVSFLFDGLGSVDYMRLKDENKEVVFEDNFDQSSDDSTM